MQDLTPLARNTLIVGWLFTAFALLFVVFSFYYCIAFRTHDFFSVGAFITGLLLVIQMTWAVTNKGGGEHQVDISEKDISLLAKVSRFFIR